MRSRYGPSIRPGPGGGRSWSVTWPACAGQSRGTVELPLWLFWSSPDRAFDLSRPFMLRSMYETVLGEAIRPEDLTAYLDGDTLIALWPDLFLPKGVRQAWEDLHPLLRSAAVTVA